MRRRRLHFACLVALGLGLLSACGGQASPPAPSTALASEPVPEQAEAAAPGTEITPDPPEGEAGERVQVAIPWRGGAMEAMGTLMYRLEVPRGARQSAPYEAPEDVVALSATDEKLRSTWGGDDISAPGFMSPDDARMQIQAALNAQTTCTVEVPTRFVLRLVVSSGVVQSTRIRIASGAFSAARCVQQLAYDWTFPRWAPGGEVWVVDVRVDMRR